MKVLIDGKEVECQECVTIIHEDQIIDTVNKVAEYKEIMGQVHIKCTHEGVIVDAVDVEGELATSMWQTVDDLVEMTH
jgi:hypothetical protein